MLEQRKTTKKQSQNSWSCFDSDVVFLPRHSGVGRNPRVLKIFWGLVRAVNALASTFPSSPEFSSKILGGSSFNLPHRHPVGASGRTLARTGSRILRSSTAHTTPDLRSTVSIASLALDDNCINNYRLSYKKRFFSESSKEKRHARFEHDVSSKTPNSAKSLSQNLVLSFVFNQLPSHRS